MRSMKIVSTEDYLELYIRSMKQQTASLCVSWPRYPIYQPTK